MRIVSLCFNTWCGEEVEGDQYLTFQSLLLPLVHFFKKVETRSNQSLLSTQSLF